MIIWFIILSRHPRAHTDGITLWRHPRARMDLEEDDGAILTRSRNRKGSCRFRV